jgi:fimbrial chaperone protein
MRNAAAFLFALGLSAALSTLASASSLKLTPITIELQAPNASATLSLENSSPEPLKLQVRVFRWSQQERVDTLTETRDVVVSPPFATLGPNSEHVLRVIRIAKTPVIREESYRLLIDEVPQAAAKSKQTVRLMLRHSLPVFFMPKEPSPADIDWKLERRKGSVRITATNAGGERLRIASLKLTDQNGKSLSLGQGLIGYVLGQSSVIWTVAAGALKKTPQGHKIEISAEGQNGPVHASAVLQ